MGALRLVKLLDQVQIVNIMGGIVPRGAYNPATDYAVGDLVTYNGSSYVMYLDAAAGTLPTNTTYWQVVSGPSGGGGSGITRSVTSTSGNFTAGSTANTDYVYIITGNHTPTMPTAVGNTNLYTFKNYHSSNVTFVFNGSEDADGGALTIAPEESVDLISNNANWRIV